MHGDQTLRVILELLILLCLGSSVAMLKRDWHRLRPPYWRLVVCALLLVVFGHAAATVLLMAHGLPITPGTWVGVGAYVLATAVLAAAVRSARRR